MSMATPNRLKKDWWCEWCTVKNCDTCKPPIQEGGFIHPPTEFEDKHHPKEVQ